MFVIKLAAGAVIIAGVLWAVYAFENYSAQRYDGQRFFNIRNLVLSSIAATLLILGRWLYAEALDTGGDDLNGVVLMVLGGLSTLAIVAWNVRRTSPLVGAVGTLLHALVFGVISLLGPTSLLVILTGWGFLIAISTVKRERNDDYDRDDNLWW